MLFVPPFVVRLVHGLGDVLSHVPVPVGVTVGQPPVEPLIDDLTIRGVCNQDGHLTNAGLAPDRDSLTFNVPHDPNGGIIFSDLT
jgi:hypothetical protein